MIYLLTRLDANTWWGPHVPKLEHDFVVGVDCSLCGAYLAATFVENNEKEVEKSLSKLAITHHNCHHNNKQTPAFAFCVCLYSGQEWLNAWGYKEGTYRAD